ncbi:MAG: DUF3810 domain-containing protein [Oscillospiraceae bacterium]|nr:DUF3810 domain-containing protein [Oscillospiraceae bacterium]
MPVPTAVSEKKRSPDSPQNSARSYFPKKNVTVMSIITALMIIMNIAAWLIDGFADFYMENLFHAISSFSAITSAVPFSVGEVLIAIGILLITVGLAAFIIALILLKDNKAGRARCARVMILVYGWAIVYILVTETMNCFVNYYTTEFSEKYHNSAGADGFTLEQLEELCRISIEKANEYAELVERDSEGSMVVPDNINDLAEEAMQALSEEYEPLSGAYPTPKKIRSSVLMTQFNLQGIYFPFTLEANYSSELMPARVPCTICHEMSHVKGFIREDEACFIAFRACESSDIPEMCYSGWISAMNYLYSAVKSNADSSVTHELYTLISDKVLADNQFVSEEFRETVEEKAVISSETAAKVSDTAMDTTLKLNGVTDGKQSYGRMVDLLLEYYYSL